MNQKEYWNKVSPTKEFTTLLEIKTLKKQLDPEAFIIDYGCGYGRTLDMLYQHGFKNTIGYDFSEGMIQRGKQTFPHLNLNVSKHNTIPLDDNSADLIILFAVLTCIINNENQASLVKEIYRVLKPGGILYFNDFLLNTDQRNINRYKAFQDKYKTYGVFELPEGAVLRHHDKSYLEQLTQPFKTMEMKQITFTTMNGHRSNGVTYLGRKKEGI